jgi:hypothetical protein
MKSRIIIIITFFGAFYLYGQDTVWKKINIDENLSIFLPGKVIQTDTFFLKDDKKMRFRVFKTQTEFSAFGVAITPNETNINADNRETLKTALDRIAKGSCTAAVRKGFTCLSSDTMVNNIPCKKTKIYKERAPFTPPIFSYIFLVNDKMYMFSTTPFDYLENMANSSHESNLLLNSIRFTSTIKEKQFDSNAESIAYKIGYYFIPALLIIGIIVYVVRKL